MVKVKESEFEGIFFIDGKIATINTFPNYKPFSEEIIKVEGKEYRIWDPYTSKPAAAIKKGIKNFPLKRGMKILYLGLAAGKTATYFSNIIGNDGLIYGIEISSEAIKDAINVAKVYRNIICILADARKPETYKNMVIDKVDIVYEDVADPDMIRILEINCKSFLKKEGFAMIAIKSQCISSTEPIKKIYKKCLDKLEENFEILDKVELDPYEKYHLFVVLRRKF